MFQVNKRYAASQSIPFLPGERYGKHEKFRRALALPPGDVWKNNALSLLCGIVL